MTPKLIIFDCDGVLIDSESLSAAATVEALQPHGVTLTVADIFARYTGRSTAETVAVIEEDHGVRLPDGFLDIKRDLTRRRFEGMLRAITGIEDLLDRVDVPVCVASGTTPDGLEHSLGLTGLWDRFAPHIFSATQVARGKPAPDLFLFAARQMEVMPDACLVIEDSVPGVQAAVAAGMPVWGFTGGSHCDADHAGRLTAAGAVQVFATMDAVQARLYPDLHPEAADRGAAHG